MTDADAGRHVLAALVVLTKWGGGRRFQVYVWSDAREIIDRNAEPQPVYRVKVESVDFRP